MNDLTNTRPDAPDCDCELCAAGGCGPDHDRDANGCRTCGYQIEAPRPTLADLLRGMLAIAAVGAMRADAPMVRYLSGGEDDPDLRGQVLDAFLATYMPDGSAILHDDVLALDDLLSGAWHDREGWAA